MKRIFTFLLTLTISLLSFGQTSTVVFSENFDSPSLGDSVTASSNSTPGWVEYSGLSVSPSNSFRDSIGSGDTSWVTTDVFSCAGNTFVLLEFDQICKIAFFDAGILEYSTDGGSTWDKLTAIDLITQDTIYLGSGNFGTSGNKFASNSYFDWLPANSSAIPTNAWWKHETFNLSTYFANETNCRLRFVLMDQNFQGSADYGWLIDNIKVTASPSEIIPPTLNIQLPYPIGNITSDGPFPVTYKSYDASGVDSVVLFYQINGGIWDSIFLTNTTGNVWTDSIPSVTTDDTVCYYAMSWDSSPAANSAREPDTGSYCFTPIPVPPVVILGTGTNTNSPSTYPAPYGTQNKRGKTQLLVTAAELAAEGLTGPLEMKSLAFNVASAAGSDLDNFYIKMGNFQGNFTGFVNTGLTTYYTNSSYSSNNGWNEHAFPPGSPFVWDGVSDIVIETCFDIPGTGSETSNAQHYYTTYPGTMVVYYQSSFSSTVCTAPTFNFSSGNRPNMRIGLGDPLGIDPGLISVISPVDGGCSLSSSESIILEYSNFGLDTLDYLPFGYILDSATVVYDTLWQTIYPGDTSTFTFANTVDLSGLGQYYEFTFFTHMPGDLGFYNDSIKGYGIQNTTQSTPYTEDFDGFQSGTQFTQGFWEQASGDDNDWWFNNVQTSTGSSPYADHTTGVSGQGNYAYFNSTWPWGHEAILISPCFDLQSMNAPKLNFWYHMFGPDVGTLYVDVLGTTGNWTNLWTDSGSTAVRQWYEQTLNLSGYAGDIVKVRFRAVHSTQGGYNGDICIDDVFVFEPSDYDVALTDVIAPENGECSYSNDEDVTINVVNFGLQSLSNVSVSYQINAGSTVTEVIAGPIPAGDTITYTFTTGADMSTSSQGYDFVFWSNHASDTLPYNDSLDTYVYHEPMISTFPYTQNFDSFTPGVFFNDPGGMDDFWARAPSDSPAFDFSWYVKTGYTNTSNTGPSGDHTYGPGQTLGNYMHTEASYGTQGSEASIISPCVDFSNLDFPFVEFYIYRYSISNAFDAFGPLIVEVNDGTGWVVADTITYQAPSPQQGYDDSWERAVANLSAVAGGKIVKIRWRALRGSTSWADFCLDDITMYQPAPKDLAIIDVVEPTQLLMEGAQGNVSAVIFNYGRDTLYSSDIRYTINGAQSTLETWSGVLYPNETDTFTFQTAFTAPGGVYDLCVIAELSGDTVQYNDTLCETRTGIEVFTVPYFNDFENGASSWVVDGGFLQWELDTPAASIIDTAYSGHLAWCTNCDGMYLDNSMDYLYTPFFDLAGNIENTLKFANLFHFENINDGGYIEYSTDGGASWSHLGTYQDSANATWWYNIQNLNMTGKPAFNNTNYPWQISTYYLGFLNGETTPIQFRFVFTTNQFVNFFNGWAIDDFEIVTPHQNSGAGIMVEVLPSNNFILPGQHPVRAKLQNTGVVDLSSVELAYFVDNPPLLANDPVNIPTPLVIEDTLTHLFSNSWTATSGIHTVCAYTHTPNDTVDANISDDTVCVEVTVFDTFDANDTSFVYCNDFEGGQNPLVGLNAFTYDTTGSWERGLPQNVYINGALSGDNAWVTGLVGDYYDKDSSAFYSPVLQVNNSHCYHIKFYHKFLTEAYQDGGIVEYSSDLGVSWNIIGDYGYPNWYNAQFVTALAPVTPGLPGFTGIQTSWELAEIDFQFPNSGPIIIRWRFASDYSVTDEGWAIDDICIENIGVCSPTTIEEKPDLTGIAVYPNPNQGQFVLNIESLIDGQVDVEIFDMLGKQIHYSLEETSVGVNKLPFDLSGLESGIYMVKVRSGNRELTERLIISR
jgi:hypothetical protein